MFLYFFLLITMRVNQKVGLKPFFAVRPTSWAKIPMRQRGDGLTAWCGSVEMG
jgi:hypothetical protein